MGAVLKTVKEIFFKMHQKKSKALKRRQPVDRLLARLERC